MYSRFFARVTTLPQKVETTKTIHLWFSTKAKSPTEYHGGWVRAEKVLPRIHKDAHGCFLGDLKHVDYVEPGGRLQPINIEPLIPSL